MKKNIKQLNEANMEVLAPYFYKFEGGFANDPHDPGGATNHGVTIGTAQSLFKKGYTNFDKNGDGQISQEDVKMFDENDFKVTLRYFWDSWKADQINNQSIANICVDWGWGSGINNAIKRVQKILGIRETGVCDDAMVQAINSAPQKELFDNIWNARKEHFEGICERRPTSRKYLNGWMRRLNGYAYSEDNASADPYQRVFGQGAPTPTVGQPTQSMPTPTSAPQTNVAQTASPTQTDDFSVDNIAKLMVQTATQMGSTNPKV